MARTVTLVIPCYNENSAVINKLVSEINSLEKKLQPFFILEKIVVDDGSDYSILQELKSIPAVNSNWKVISFTRNFGKEAALKAGLEYSSGEAVIPIDADLQDPIEVIPEMLNIWNNTGVPVVLAKRVDRSSDTLFKKTSANIFYKVINSIAETEISPNVGDFRLLDRKVVEVLNSLKEKNLFMKGLYSWPGFKSTTIEFVRPMRSQGKSKFTIKKLVKFALDGIVSFSSFPIRMWSWIGLSLAALSVGYSVLLIILRLMGKIEIPGYTSILVISLLSISLNLICFGILGEYLSRMFLEIKNRPAYVVDHVRVID